MSPVTMATTAFTAATTIVSTMATIVQHMPTPTPTTTVPLPEPSETASESSGPSLFVPEPYYSGTSFFASIANILYMFVYTIPRGIWGVLELCLMAQKRREALAKEAEERSHRIQQTEGINKLVVLMESMVEDNKALKEDKKGLSQRLERVETENKALRQTVATAETRMEGMEEENKALRQTVERLETGMKEENKALRQRVERLESRVEGMEKENKALKEGITEAVTKGTKEGIKDSLTEASQAMTEAVKEGVKEGFKDAMKEVNQTTSDGVERVVTAIQGLEGVLKVGLEGVETRIRGIEYRVDWMLDYHLDENERIHALKAILPGLLKTDDSTSTASSSTPWGGDLVENRVIVDEGDWEDHKKPWEN